MKNVLLYPRVSSDEQADKGYSLRAQDEGLRDHCVKFEKNVLGVYSEDFSAWYGFDRPEWNKILKYVKTSKNTALPVHEVLFTKWDRFARNVPEAYAMIEIMRKLGVVVNATEQPLDVNLPESKIMLAVYLSVAEADNDRRSLNTRQGMRRAQSEGRYLGMAPFGYKNSRDAQDKPIIVPDPKRVEIVRDIFEKYIAGMPNQDILKRAQRLGFNNSGHDAIKRIVSNCTYIGYVMARAHQDMEAKMVKGLHEAIIPEEYYWAANARLTRENIPQPKMTREELPLRGVLFCDECSKLHSGGRVSGRRQKYWYYMCHRCGNQNYRADRVHKEMMEMLQSMSLQKDDVAALITKAEQQMDMRMKQDTRLLDVVTGEYNAVKAKLASLHDKYVSDRIDHDTYLSLKGQYGTEIAAKELRIKELSQNKNHLWQLFNANLPKLTDLYSLYDVRPLPAKQELIRALFPGCLNRVKEGFKTPYLIEPFEMSGMEIKHLSVVPVKRIIPISAEIPMRVPHGNEFEHLLKLIAA